MRYQVKPLQIALLYLHGGTTFTGEMNEHELKTLLVLA